ncbi:MULTISPECIES: hypothetical protein [unclassified Paenibacillus]|uniref:hypothetical protein n=1 Tax=unclassified Paenibacillus TaxID=185978 RepID=UPI0008D7EED4|nr:MULTISPECIES: hypothetical protein [unclassified Paenibacillus]QLG40418.1 hypothetical protein HW560_21435 [Paenibacillus sp. E222]SEN71083.1 hypothetical protein SAMN05518670_2489 [Paenibacillus sp. OK076]
MKKMYIGAIVLLLLSVPVATFAANSVSEKISIKINNTEIKTKTDVEPTIINNRLYVPVNIFRDAGFSVSFKNSTLTMVNRNLYYAKNLEELNAFHYTFINHFQKIDQEITNILGNLLLQNEIDTTKLMELIRYVEIESKGFNTENFTPIMDYSSSFAFASANESINAYKEAVNSLITYTEDEKKEDLERFYAQREIALKYYADFSYDFDLVFKRSYFNVIKY